MDNQQVPAIAHGTLLSVMWQPGWGGSFGGEWIHVKYGWVTSLFICNCHGVVRQLHPSFTVVQLLSHVHLFATPWTAAPWGCPSPSPRACSNSCPLSRWCHPTISSSVVPFFSCLQSFLASGSFLISQFFTSGSQSIGSSASSLVLPMNIQGWFPLGLTSWISLQSKGLSRAFPNTTVQKHHIPIQNKKKFF